MPGEWVTIPLFVPMIYSNQSHVDIPSILRVHFIERYTAIDDVSTHRLRPIRLPAMLIQRSAWIGSIQVRHLYFTATTFDPDASAQYAFCFIPGLFMGQLFDRGYLKVPLATGSILLVVFTLLVAECKVYWQFLLCQGFAVGVS